MLQACFCNAQHSPLTSINDVVECSGYYVEQWHCVYCIQKGLLLNCWISAAPSLPQKGSLLFKKTLPFQ